MSLPLFQKPSAIRPYAGDSRRAARYLANWLELCDSAARARFDAAASAEAEFPPFVAAVLDGSTFLRDAAWQEPQAFCEALVEEPDERFAACLLALPEAVATAADDMEVMQVLRRWRRRATMTIAIADLAGAWSGQQVQAALSELAEIAVRATLRKLLLREAASGRIVPLDSAAPERDCGYFVLGMGKLGARELNFSSDIDLIAFYDRDRVHLRDPDAHQGVFVRLTQSLARLLSERTYDGFAFRVDLRLRPDPGTYPVAVSTTLAEHYYEALGQNWERAAMIKARPIAGDLVAGEAFLRAVRPFIYRKYLDYAAIAEVHAMKRQIHAAKGHDVVAVDGHDLKLGRGGIREVEFFVQTQQLIGGGRDARLRVRETLVGLDALSDAGWIDAKTRTELADAYLELRRLEHRLQMVADEQTHTLPIDPKAVNAFARFAGFPSRRAFARALARVLARVQGHYARLFEDSTQTQTLAGPLDFADATAGPETIGTLRTMGFIEPARAADVIRGWFEGRLPATRTATARERLTDILPRLVTALSASGQPDAGLVAFDRFVSRLPAGVQLFSLLRANSWLLDLLATLVGTAPRMVNVLGQRPRLLEGVVDQFRAHQAEPIADLEARLERALADTATYEDALDATRVFAQEHIFLVGMRFISGALSASAVAPMLSRIGDTVVAALHQRASAEHARRYGRTPKDVSAIVAMGKFGSQEMTAASDLDLLLLYDDTFDAPSDGPRSLYASEYYTRLTQRLVAALSAPTAEGVVYAVDLRLRPSGNKGPVATSLASFVEYHARESWTWEHMALARARVVSAPPAFADAIERAIAEVLCRPRDPEKLLADVLDMRRMIAAEKPPRGAWDIKMRPGGQVDVEFVAQWLVLRHAHRVPTLLKRATAPILEAARDADLLAPRDAQALIDAAKLYDALTQTLRLAIDEPLDPRTASRGLNALVARAAAMPDITQVEAELEDSVERVRRVLRNLWSFDPAG